MSESTAVSPPTGTGREAGDLARAALQLPARTPASQVEEIRETLADFLSTAPEELGPWARHQAATAGVQLRPVTGWTPRRRRTVRRVLIIAVAHVVGLGFLGSACEGTDDDAAPVPAPVPTVLAT